MPGNWKPINVPSWNASFPADIMLLLTDASVLVHKTSGAEWLRLTPDMSQADPNDRYANGIWSSETFDMAHSREYFASGVLPDGRLFVIGGEYLDESAMAVESPLGEIFDPLTNMWAPITKPDKFDFVRGDASATVLPDGRVLLGGGPVNPYLMDVAQFNKRTAIWDPVANTWVEAGLQGGQLAATSKDDPTAEEGFNLLPDGTVMAVEVINAPRTEKYLPSLDKWVSAGSTPVNLAIQILNDVEVYEIGPAVVLPNGSLFAIGASGQTALYTADADATQPGTWTAGPSLPADPNGAWPTLTSIDAPACLMPSGKVIFAAGSAILFGEGTIDVDYFSLDSRFFEYDPSSNATVIPPLDAQAPFPNITYTYQIWLLLLPTGQVLCSYGTGGLLIYTPDSNERAPDPAWRPANITAPNNMHPGGSYTVSGTQLNGLSQAVSYGDDGQMATNYPIIQLTSVANGKSVYARTHDFSTMGMATGTRVPQDLQSCVMDIPAIATGDYDLTVFANGIPSVPVRVTITPWPRLAESIAQIIEGIIQDGGGLAFIGGHIVRVPPYDPGYDVLNALAAISFIDKIRGPAAAAARAAIWKTIGAIAEQNAFIKQ